MHIKAPETNLNEPRITKDQRFLRNIFLFVDVFTRKQNWQIVGIAQKSLSPVNVSKSFFMMTSLLNNPHEASWVIIMSQGRRNIN